MRRLPGCFITTSVREVRRNSQTQVCSHLVGGFIAGVLQAEVDHGVLQSSTHVELQRQVVDPLGTDSRSAQLGVTAKSIIPTNRTSLRPSPQPQCSCSTGHNRSHGLTSAIQEKILQHQNQQSPLKPAYTEPFYMHEVQLLTEQRTENPTAPNIVCMTSCMKINLILNILTRHCSTIGALLH